MNWYATNTGYSIMLGECLQRWILPTSGQKTLSSKKCSQLVKMLTPVGYSSECKKCFNTSSHSNPQWPHSEIATHMNWQMSLSKILNACIITYFPHYMVYILWKWWSYGLFLHRTQMSFYMGTLTVKFTILCHSKIFHSFIHSLYKGNYNYLI